MKGEKGTAAEAFEDLHMYQRARELTNDVYRLTRQGEFSRPHRQAVAAQQERVGALRAAQLASLHTDSKRPEPNPS